MKKITLLLIIPLLFLISCTKEELTISEISELEGSGNLILDNTVYKPWHGMSYKSGIIGGEWHDIIINDPKTFNQLIGERDNTSNTLIRFTLDFLFDYDSYSKEWIPHAASYEIETNEEKNILIVHCKLRDDLYWSYYGKNEKIPITSDDFVYWYNNILGNPDFNSNSYSGQFLSSSNKEKKHIDCIKIDEKKFDFVFPRIVSDPLLLCNMFAAPIHIYKKVYETEGVEGVKNLFTINCNPLDIPSCGKFYITEYIPGQRVVLQRNPFYWEKDSEGISIPYNEKMILKIVNNKNLAYLLFKQGSIDSYSPDPEELADLVEEQKNGRITIFRNEGSQSAAMWSFNQNPLHKDENYYYWFTKKEFRQAMSCLLNRDRIVNQTYRGLATPKYDFFPEVNPFYDKDIQLKYRYDVEKSRALLKSCGFIQKDDGFLYDDKNNKVEFNLYISSSSATLNDIGQIVVDECSKVGIVIHIHQLDNQKIVEMLTKTYDWESVFISLGNNTFPSQGRNLWPSTGNYHLWYPRQKSPATDWEKRIDYLYNEGCSTIDNTKAKEIWDEYQSIILEECPVIYLVKPIKFIAVNNKWDLSNYYFDSFGEKKDFIFEKK